jgi:hypothetical protein
MTIEAVNVDESRPRTPTRWREPGTGRLLPIPDVLLRLLGARLRRDDPRFVRHERALLEGDPLADDVVDLFRSKDGAAARRAFEDALERGADRCPDLPRPVAELFAQVERVPPWLDEDALRLGTDTILRVGRGGTYALGGASLMSGYLSRGAIKPLVATGALTRMARRRVSETGKYLFDLATSGDVGRFTDGWKSTIRVRLMHATVRRECAASPRWRTDEWGVPINQRDMLGTHLEFSIAYIGGLTAQGFVLSRREREAIMHLWRYVGLLLGIPEDLLPATFAEGLELAWIFNQTEAGPDDDSRALAAALVEAWSTGMPGRSGITGTLEGRFLTGFSRLILGRRASNQLALPDDAWKYAALVVAPARASLEVLRLVTPRGHERAVRRGRAVLASDLRAGLEGRVPTFEHPRTAPATA